MRSLYIETLAWRDKTYGNTYFSSRIWVDGKLKATLPFQYGYERMDEHKALEHLLAHGILPASTSSLYGSLEGVDYYRSYAMAKKAEVERHGNYEKF